jgi:hypothetical protein
MVTSSVAPPCGTVRNLAYSFSSLTPLFLSEAEKAPPFHVVVAVSSSSPLAAAFHLQWILPGLLQKRRYDFPSPIPHSPSPRSSILPAVRIGSQAAATAGQRTVRKASSLGGGASSWVSAQEQIGDACFFSSHVPLSWLGVKKSQS